MLIETKENVLQLIKWDPFEDNQRLTCQYTGFKNTSDIFIGDSMNYIYLIDSEYSESKGNLFKLYQRALGKSGDKSSFSVVDEGQTKPENIYFSGEYIVIFNRQNSTKMNHL